MDSKPRFLSGAAVLPPLASANDTSDLVLSSGGSLPLLLTVPHDGTEAIGSVSPRKKGTKARDVGTRQLAEKVATLLEQRLGGRPRMVIAKFSRKFLDSNRPEHEAMESLAALPTYRAYHGQLAFHVAELKKAFPDGALLLDIHGQSREPGVTFRGTRAGLTVKTLLKRHGVQAVQGDSSIIGVLASLGYQVDPSVGSSSLREDPRYAGGYTVIAYGSHQTGGIDAIQLEFGKHHRANPHLAAHVAEALVTFLTHYELVLR